MTRISNEGAAFRNVSRYEARRKAFFDRLFQGTVKEDQLFDF